MSDHDRQYMQRCLELAAQAAGQTAPNPMVGCIIVQGEEIVGEGFHPAAGQPHAEVFALRQAGDRARGATLYVNLEPCNHYGRTPPCSEAVVAAGLKRVVVGMVDPDPRVAGGGIARLQQAGIEVTVGVEQAACEQLNEAFVWRVTQRRPFGILKYAMTLDGRIAASTGHSAWVSSPESRRQVHSLRSQVDAVIVGGNTVRLDNPRLTCHDISDRHPLRVVMSRRLDLPLEANLWQTEVAPTIVFTEAEADRDRCQHLANQGVEVIERSPLTPSEVSAELFNRGLSTLLWECGGTLAAAALREGQIQKLLAFIAPKLIGGPPGYSPVGDLGLLRMDQALKVERSQWQAIGPDLCWTAYLDLVSGQEGVS
ncbi:bifunctional diaminohydroxyphosphoribosylaminopyrimidine deaminase/5-amino-6-(5-phosphoribosylamino)uracil reductase RibD [Synechococcus elongatus]|uniref:bifunctional diaminohydroxyphosphoribosylaminopyrimidine deaminase/5-amino-6-(5-phosphoribosylamino)uracil reductase RibD n=1 Tax=Synechococcus elongatus TaxID=32046 RepID=UPI000F7DD8FB|nr:bifunctional diaminohydroxyphosphoribosylaminopyrimidine deaminase/5-amino-6-(5-phosphoribosylamino)uracil reductase RibD [Synechococcus elongatus]